jgi:diadenosine tetraphosphate (Ap4A) HIT family hydrolase
MKKVFETIPNSREDASTPWTTVVREDFHVAVYLDKYPCTEGHMLFVPQYNTVDILQEAVMDAINHGIDQVKAGEWDGFNIGFNYGESAGQTVPWPHIHLIPRRKGDVPDPVGGVRHTIPGRGNYRTAPAGTWPHLDEER